MENCVFCDLVELILKPGPLWRNAQEMQNVNWQEGETSNEIQLIKLNVKIELNTEITDLRMWDKNDKGTQCDGRLLLADLKILLVSHVMWKIASSEPSGCVSTSLCSLNPCRWAFALCSGLVSSDCLLSPLSEQYRDCVTYCVDPLPVPVHFPVVE